MAHASTYRRPLLTAVAMSAVAATTILPTAALASPVAASARVSHPKGFFTTDGGQVPGATTESALVLDPKNGQHVITVEPSKTTAGMGHLVYLTRKSGAHKWTSRAIPGLRPTTGIRLEAQLSASKKRVSIVVFECDGVYVADSAVTAIRMPEPTTVQAQNNCATATSVDNEPPLTLSYAWLQRDIRVMLPDPSQDGQPAMFEGAPAGTFRPLPAIPAADDVTVNQVAYDPQRSTTVAVGEGTDGTNEGIYVLKQVYGEWTTPVLIATLDSPTEDYTVESVAANNGQVWVGLEQTVTTATTTTHRLYIDHSTPSGQWDGVIPLPHDTGKDTSLRLLVNHATGSLHAAYTHVDLSSKTKKSGIMEEVRTGSRWSKPRQSTHWYRDIAQQITIGSAGKVVVSYTQR